MASLWTDDRIILLKQLWEDGLTCSQIAAKIAGFSRCAIIGKVHRLKLNGRDYANGPVRPQLDPEERRQLKNARQNRRNASERARRVAKPHLFTAAEQRRRAADKKEARSIMVQNGAPLTSPQYRKHLPRLAEMTRNELRAMLKLAVQNTAAMGVT